MNTSWIIQRFFDKPSAHCLYPGLAVWRTRMKWNKFREPANASGVFRAARALVSVVHIVDQRENVTLMRERRRPCLRRLGTKLGAQLCVTTSGRAKSWKKENSIKIITPALSGMRSELLGDGQLFDFGVENSFFSPSLIRLVDDRVLICSWHFNRLNINNNRIRERVYFCSKEWSFLITWCSYRNDRKCDETCSIPSGATLFTCRRSQLPVYTK